MTNYEKIKSMSSKELGKFLNNHKFCAKCSCSDCGVPKDCCGFKTLSCDICINKWLESEASENEQNTQHYSSMHVKF